MAFAMSANELMQDLAKLFYWPLLIIPHFTFCDTFAQLIKLDKLDYKKTIYCKVNDVQDCTLEVLEGGLGKDPFLNCLIPF